jgi:hypothetical protein
MKYDNIIPESARISASPDKIIAAEIACSTAIYT